MRFCPLSSGSGGNALYIEGGGTAVLVDCGVTGKRLFQSLDEKGIDLASIRAILVTHDHTDHTSGVGIVSRKLGVPVYANAATWDAMRNTVGALKSDNMRVFETARDFFIGALNIFPCPTSHDAAESVCYIFTDGERKLSEMTDTGVFTESMAASAAGSDLIYIESNHDLEMLKCGPYPYPLKRRILSERGHLSNDACAEALIRLYPTGVRRAVLGHLSEENNFESLALTTVRAALRDADIPDAEFALSCAHRDAPGEIYEF